jgi:predicted DNA-binding protein (UPF0251 family)
MLKPARGCVQTDSPSITIREVKALRVTLPDDLASWLTEAARKSGISRERFVRIELERARKMSTKPFLRLVGRVEGAPDLSTRKGFSKS